MFRHSPTVHIDDNSRLPVSVNKCELQPPRRLDKFCSRGSLHIWCWWLWCLMKKTIACYGTPFSPCLPHLCAHKITLATCMSEWAGVVGSLSDWKRFGDRGCSQRLCRDTFSRSWTAGFVVSDRVPSTRRRRPYALASTTFFFVGLNYWIIASYL